MIGKEGAALALLLLGGQFGGELRQQRAPQIPQFAQLIEHQRRIARLRLRQARLQGLQHFLHARGRAFLLLDAILHALHFILQRDMGFLQFRAIAKQVQHAVVVDLEFISLRAESQETQL